MVDEGRYTDIVSVRFPLNYDSTDVYVDGTSKVFVIVLLKYESITHAETNGRHLLLYFNSETGDIAYSLGIPGYRPPDKDSIIFTPSIKQTEVLDEFLVFFAYPDLHKDEKFGVYRLQTN